MKKMLGIYFLRPKQGYDDDKSPAEKQVLLK